MKLSLLAMATAASAAAVTKRDVVFEARNFTASCVPHSAMCHYSLNAFMPGTMDTQGYDCSASAPGAGVAILPEIQGGTCPPSSRTFDVVRSEEGLTVIVSVQVSRLSYTRGSHFIPNDQIKMIEGVTPTGGYQAYVGPKDFPLERIV
ncbi:uncharacterized protein B0H64DRAFT_227402 [Chaetomium fimeti]|jgi:hypothetical protein|uniref:Hypersensitive response-inducing protein n=1 Tax=Chaetomium fimeti TaxID=1854472 RepID=A0AAE0H9I3_9PEZI|nr:hypothetical protein B0H64DRAFT_227402 [Chaetomium fimeti]